MKPPRMTMQTQLVLLDAPERAGAGWNGHQPRNHDPAPFSPIMEKPTRFDL
jgi:hypothetical protein